MLGRYWAGHLAAGPDTALGDLSGAAFLGIRSWSGEVHVSAPKHRRNHQGVVVHQVTGLGRSMILTRRGLPVMRPEYLLLDLAVRLGADPLAVAVNEALARQLVWLTQLERVIDERVGHRGLGALSDAVAAARDDPGAGSTRSRFEELVLLKLRAVEGLPPFLRNHEVRLGDGRVAVADVYFLRARVMLELDSRTWHEQRRAMDSDRRRDQQALSVGVLTFRVTWHQVVDEWPTVVSDLSAVLDRAARTSDQARRS